MKSRIQSIMLACMALAGAFLASCTDDALVEASESYAGSPFELTVTQPAPASRLELGQDGLTTVWEPGDQLALVDVNRTLAPIFLNCTLEEPAKTATFVAESGVPAGTYYVIYNYNNQLAYRNEPFQSVDDINQHDNLVLWNTLTIEEGVEAASVSLQHLYAKIKVVLKNVPTDFSGGYVGMYSPKQGFPMYKLFSKNGLVDAEYGLDPYSMSYSSTKTYLPSNRKYHNVRLGRYQPYETTSDYSKAAELSALVFPADLSQEDLFFYILNGDKCYEIKKSKEVKQIKLEAGISYTVELDMSQASATTLNRRYASSQSIYQINNAAEWRHAAYLNATPYDGYTYFYEYANYEILENIDFGGQYFFPIAARNIYGNEKKLSNITLEWPHEDNVGLTRYEWYYNESNDDYRKVPYNIDLLYEITCITDLTLENVVFKGKNQVGAFGGWNVDARNCKVIGNSVIEGQGNDVGGIVGLNTFNSPKCVNVSLGNLCKVSGKNYVGGIVGRYISGHFQVTDYYDYPTLLLMENCKSEATVTGSEDYVGGIFGKIGGNFSGSQPSISVNFALDDNTFSLVKCVNEGDVTGRHYVGGIGGDFRVTLNGSSSTLDRIVLSQSCSSGDVSGDSHVGGIMGTSSASTNTCYSVGTVTSQTAHAGGIVGSMPSGYQARIANCYSLATLTPGADGKAGGIVGSTRNLTVTNCYYAANPATYTYGGIVGHSDGSVTVSHCLTTLNSLGTNLGEHKERTGCPDSDNDGKPDWDWNNDGKYDDYDLYYFYNDNVSDSYTGTSTPQAVTSILEWKWVINSDNAYADTYWPLQDYPWYCVKFASFSADTDAPEFDEDGF